MSHPLHRWFTWAFAAGLIWLPLGQAVAQQASAAADPQPVLVVSIASSDELLGDIGFLTEAAGAGDIGRLVALMAAPYTTGLQRGKPAGVYATIRGQEEFEAVGFFAVRDLKVVLSTLQDQLGQPRDAGDGVLELATDRPQSVFVKEQQGWAFFANRKALLNDLPADPAEMLGDLPKKYTLAARINVPAIPADLRNQAIEQIRRGFEESLQGQVRDERQAELARRIGRRWIDSTVAAIKGAESLTLGWEVDAQARATHLEVSVTALPDSQFARDLAKVQETKSDFAGLARPDAAASFLVATPHAQADVEQALALLEVLRGEAMKGIDQDPNLTSDEERARAKKIVGQFLEVAEETVKAGKLDAGGSLILKPRSLTAVVGGFVSDGEKLAAALKELHAFAQSKDPNVPAVNFGAETHRGVTLHTASLPLRRADQNARDVLGVPLQIVIGTGPTSVYLAFGKEAKQVLTSSLDASAEQTDQKVAPFHGYIALTPIMEFATSVSDNPMLPEVLATLRKVEGKDRIALAVEPIESGVSVRLTLDEGVLASIGQAVRVLAPLLQNLRQR